MTTFIDTNVIIDAISPNSPNHEWAVSKLSEADQPLVLCDVVYSELSVGIDSIENTDIAIGKFAIERYPFSKAALFRAGKAFKKYKDDNAGPKSNVLSDFLIGAQAEAEGAPLITANSRDFTTYFPGISLVCPQTEQK